ncbi:MAG: hypothetical protein FWH33_00350 [Oscillospiraceae bacterium]|nr:hypothetical protein [Oscillospiraceae bacterium]
MKIKIISGILVLVVAVIVSGATMLAAAAPGSQSDPFITLDYLDNKFKPAVIAEARTIAQDITQSFEGKISALEERMKANQGGAAASAADVFSVVTLNRGQTLTCSVGTEIMLRIGTASCFGSDPALVNYTGGATLESGAALVQNNMYLVTIEGNGIKASADLVRVLARGSYKIS